MQERRSDVAAALLAGFALGIVLIALWMTLGGGETATGLRADPDSVIEQEAAATREAEAARDGMIYNADARVQQRLAADAVRTRPLTGALRIRARDVRWLDAAGDAWVRAPIASASLDANAVRGGNVLLQDVVLERTDIRLVQSREGAPWNYESALDQLMNGDDGGGARRFAIDGLRIRDARVDVRLPDDHLTFESIDAEARSALLAGPGIDDPRLQFTRLTTSLVLHQRDRRIAVAATTADVRVLDDGVGFDVASLRIDESQLADLDGVWSRSLPGWGFRMTGRAIDVRLADVQFLAPERIPEDGTASFRFAIDPESEARTHVVLTDIDAQSGESRIFGSVAAVVLPEGFSIQNADLRVDPLQLALIEQVLERELPYAGTLRGTLRGDAGNLQFDVDAQLTSAESEIPLVAALEGAVAFTDAGGFELRRLVATLEDAPLASLRAVVPGIPFGGTISGTIALEGLPEQAPLNVDVRLRMASGVFAVAGVVDLTGAVPTYDLSGNVIGLNLADMFTAFAPPAQLTGRFTLAGSGIDPASMDARITLGGRFTGWETTPNDVIRARALVRGGAVQVDTLSMRLATLALESSGRWQFVAPQSGAIEYALDITSLAPWGPYIPVVGDSTMRGALAARGTVTGPLEAIRVAGAVRTVNLRAANGWRTEQLDATYDVAFGAAVPTVRLEATAQTVTTPTAGAFDVLTADLELTPPLFTLALAGDRAGAEGPVVELVADGRVPYEGLREIVVQRAHLDIEEGVWRLTRPATFSWGEGTGLLVRDLEFRNEANEGRVALEGTVLPLSRANLQIDVARVPIGDVQRLLGLEPTVTGDLWAAGVFSTIDESAADVDMTFRLDSGAVLGVALSRLEGTLEYRGGTLVTNAVAAFDTAGTLDIELAVPFDVALADSVQLGVGEAGAISGRITADSLSLAPFDALLTEVRDMEGRVTGTLTIGGSIDEPDLEGALRVANGALTVTSLDQRWEQITGTLTLDGRIVTIPALTAQAGGTMTLTGTIELEELTEPVFDLAATLDGFQVMGVDDESPAEVGGSVSVEGPLLGLVMTGDVRVTDGAVLIPDFTGSTLDEDIFLEPGEMRLNDPLAATGNPVLDNLTVRGLEVDIGGDVWFIVENQVRAQLAGELTVNKIGDEWRVIGELEGERGTYTLSAGPIVRRFDINYARLTFQDETELNPTLEVLASRTIIDQTGRPVDIDVNIGGTMQQPTLALGSGETTGIPQSELLSFLFFGQPSFALGGGALPGSELLEQTFVGGIAELASIELQNELGDAGLPLDVFQIRLGGFGALAGAPMLVLGREVADDVFLTVESYLSGLFGASQSGLDLWAIRLEWAFDRRSSLRAGLEPVHSALRLHGIGGLDAATVPGQQFSLELRRRWTY